MELDGEIKRGRAKNASSTTFQRICEDLEKDTTRLIGLALETALSFSSDPDYADYRMVYDLLKRCDHVVKEYAADDTMHSARDSSSAKLKSAPSARQPRPKPLVSVNLRKIDHVKTE